MAGSALLRDGLPTGSLFQIGQSLASGVVIEFENDPLDLDDVGLQGQVVINQNAGSGTWSGTVQVNDGSTVAALTPNYTTLSTHLGGGASGLAPFNFHQFTGPLPASRADLDCNPFHTEWISVGDCEEVTDLNEVVIDHYGPVFVTGDGPHFRVEFRAAFTGGGPVWTDVTSQFEVDTTQTATADGSTNRKAVIVPAAGNSSGFNAAGFFRFRPLSGKVKSANVTGTPDVAYDSSVVSGDLGNTSSGTQYDWYQFRVGLVPPCPGGSALFEGDQVNASDLAAWIDAPFEVNMDGQVCSQDFADMSAAYNNQ